MKCIGEWVFFFTFTNDHVRYIKTLGEVVTCCLSMKHSFIAVDDTPKE